MAKKQTKKPYSYPPAFREKALATWEKLRAQGMKSPEAAKAAGVSEQTLYGWKSRRDGQKPPSVLAARQPERPRALVAKRERAYDPEIAELKREIDRLREENEILTATVTMFARRRS